MIIYLFIYFVHIVLFRRHHFQTSKWEDIQIISLQTGKLSVRVAGEEVAAAQAVYKNDQFKEFYIGGAPQELRERY